MKLRCTFLEPAFAKALAEFYTIGKTYAASIKPGSKVGAVLVESNEGNEGEQLAAVPSRAGFEVQIKNQMPIAKFEVVGKRTVKLVKTEKSVTLKLDGVGKSDKRRFRRVCRQYRKLKFINPGFYYDLESDRHMANLARYHRR